MTELLTDATSLTFSDMVVRARTLVCPGERRILGITGAPGAGKTTLARALTDALGEQAVLVAMDGFHFANAVLHAHHSRDRKGAPDTFDIGGYVALLHRLRDQHDEVVYAPEFDRAADAAIGSAIPVTRTTPLVITEGNYLLLGQHGWASVRLLLDESWFIAPPEDVRQERLIRRHELYGLSEEQARDWALGSDERNARLVAETRGVADLVARVRDIPLDSTSNADPAETTKKGQL